MLILDAWLTKAGFQLLPHNVFFDYLNLFFSGSGRFIFLVSFIIVIFCLWTLKNNPLLLKQTLLGIVMIFLTVNLLGKPLFKRTRPYTNLWKGRVEVARALERVDARLPTDFSFPSGHAAYAFFGATLLSLTIPGKKKKRSLTAKLWVGVFFLVAFAVSYSRIYLGVHYFGDVLSGGIIGFFIAVAMKKPNSKFK
jgi:undecaprenyl-diphosphatase